MTGGGGRYVPFLLLVVVVTTPVTAVLIISPSLVRLDWRIMPRATMPDIHTSSSRRPLTARPLPPPPPPSSFFRSLLLPPMKWSSSVLPPPSSSLSTLPSSTLPASRSVRGVASGRMPTPPRVLQASCRRRARPCVGQSAERRGSTSVCVCGCVCCTWRRHARPAATPSNSVSDLSQEHSMANDTTTFFTINKIVLLVDLRNQITLVSLS